MLSDCRAWPLGSVPDRFRLSRYILLYLPPLCNKLLQVCFCRIFPNLPPFCPLLCPVLRFSAPCVRFPASWHFSPFWAKSAARYNLLYFAPVMLLPFGSLGSACRPDRCPVSDRGRDPAAEVFYLLPCFPVLPHRIPVQVLPGSLCLSFCPVAVFSAPCVRLPVFSLFVRLWSTLPAIRHEKSGLASASRSLGITCYTLPGSLCRGSGFYPCKSFNSSFALLYVSACVSLCCKISVFINS